MRKIIPKDFPFETSIEDVLRFLGPEARLYSDDSRVFIRELIQNAIDAIIVNYASLQHQQQQGKKPVLAFLDDFRSSLKTPYHGQVNVSFRSDPQGNAIIVEDNGIGLDEMGMRHLAHPLRGIEHYLGEELDLQTRNQVIGHFGAGLLSVFKVSDHIEIESHRYGQPACLLDIRIRHLEHPDERGQLLALDSHLEPSTKKSLGTRVTVHLESSSKETQTNILSIDSATKVEEALTHYIRRMPPNISLFFSHGSSGPKIISSQPFHGSEKQPRHELQIPGVIGFIAYDGLAKETMLIVCQRGVLVKGNYPNLLPEGTLSIVGEIDLQTTTRLSLKPSREEFVEDEALAQIKRALKDEVDSFMTNEYPQWETENMTQLAHQASPGQTIDEEDSPLILNYISLYEAGSPTILPHIKQKVAFRVKTKDSPSGKLMLSYEINELCKEKGKRKIYLYERQTRYVYSIGTLDGMDMFEHPTGREVHAQAAIENGDIIININEHGEDHITMSNIIKKALDDLSNGQINVISLNSDASAESIINKIPLPESPHSSIQMIHLSSAGGKRVFRSTGKYRSSNKTYINEANEKVGRILKGIDRIQANGDLKNVYRAYINMLAGRFDEAILNLETVLIPPDQNE